MKNEDILKENDGKKFDIVLMNPPYDRSLHLKFLEKTIKIADNVISIQPVRWLEEVNIQEVSSQAKKYENTISKHIKDLEILYAEKSKKDFNVNLSVNLGIYVCDNNGGYNYKALSENSIIKKILDYIKDNKCNIEINKKDGYRVRVPFIGAGKTVGKTSKEQAPRLSGLDNVNIKDIVYKDGKYDSKWWYDYYNRNQYSKITEEITSSIKFDSEEEGHNFVRSFRTDFGKYVESFLIVDVQINNKKILWMGNAKHPRTGKIGYKSEWKDEDFDKFFKLTEEEINKYHKYISDFENIRKQWFKDHNKEYRPQ